LNSRTCASFWYAGEATSFRYVVVTTPLTASAEPADARAAAMKPGVAPTELTILFGRQPSRYAVTSAVIDSVGVATTRNVSAPDARSRATGPGITDAPPARG
jgi:hypothetical protein